MHDAVVVGAGLSGLAAAHRLARRRRRCRRAGGGEPGRRPRVDAGRPRAARWEAGGEAVDLVEHPPAWRWPRRSGPSCGGRRSGGATTGRRRSSGTWRARNGAPDVAGYRSLLAELVRRGADPEADDRFTVAEWMARDGAGMFDLAVAETAVVGHVVDDAGQAHVAPRAGREVRPPEAAPATARSCGSSTGRAGSPRRLAARLGDRVRLRSAAAAVRARGGGVEVDVRRRAAPRRACDRRRASARPGPDRRPAGRPHRLATASPPSRSSSWPTTSPPSATAVLTDTALGYAYRHDPRTLGSFVGSTPAAWLLRPAAGSGDRGGRRGGARARSACASRGSRGSPTRAAT